MIELTNRCVRCEARNRVKLADTGAATEIRCPACGEVRSLTELHLADGVLRSCVACGTEDLYAQKDFPQNLGMAILVVGFGVSTLFWYWQMPVETFAVLIGSVVLDAILYALVPDVVICYRCLGQYRGLETRGAARYRPFDLEVGERYRQERIRVAGLRERGATTATQGTATRQDRK
jgi:uncharacterized protein (DUF983 family)